MKRVWRVWLCSRGMSFEQRFMKFWWWCIHLLADDVHAVCVCMCVCVFLFICDVESWSVFVGFWKLTCVAWGSHSALRLTCWGNKSCIRWIQDEKGTLHLPNLSTIAMETETQACRWCTCSKSIRSFFYQCGSKGHYLILPQVLAIPVLQLQLEMI